MGEDKNGAGGDKSAAEGSKGASEGSNRIGRTCWDFLSETLDNKHRLVLVIALVAVAVILACTGIYVASPKVEIGPSGSVSMTPRFGQRTVTLLVHPFGWQASGVTVKKDHPIDIAAGGQVNVGYIDYLTRHMVPQEHDVFGCFSDCYSKEKWDKVPRWPWVDPGSDEIVEGVAARAKLVAPMASRGRLVAAVVPRGGHLEPMAVPDAGSIIVPSLKKDGTATSVKPPSDGDLWFAVNDEPDWYFDNLGNFSVTVQLD